jgi:hypothetical protein
MTRRARGLSLSSTPLPRTPPGMDDDEERLRRDVLGDADERVGEL